MATEREKNKELLLRVSLPVNCTGSPQDGSYCHTLEAETVSVQDSTKAILLVFASDSCVCVCVCVLEAGGGAGGRCTFVVLTEQGLG